MKSPVASLCRWIAVALSFASAYFWYKASKAKVTEADNSLGMELKYADPDNKEKNIHVLATAKKQTELNAIAAKLIAWAIFFQAVALVLDSF
jgi:hypothetical protein